MKKETIKAINCELPINTPIKIRKVGDNRFGYLRLKKNWAKGLKIKVKKVGELANEQQNKNERT